jgi:REP element-mobilizing transposase RayT
LQAIINAGDPIFRRPDITQTYHGAPACGETGAIRPYLADVKPNRRSIRLPGYDYASAGWYFVTIICHNRKHLFGEVVGAYGIRPQDPEVILSRLGTIVQEEWLKTAELRPEVELGEFVVMPNHFHAIIGLNGHEGTDDLALQTALQSGMAGVLSCPEMSLHSQV